tara:strand:+ start:5433 stop:6425 length:993 start_codon:yes stop_codon:yes gene_type:complete
MHKLFLLFIVFIFFGCSENNSLQIHRGYALGTSYNIQYSGIKFSFEEVQFGIDSLITVINKSLSTYISNSDISKINSGDSLLVIDKHFKNIFYKATEVWTNSGGLFDPTVGAWVNAYGFGPEKPINFLTEEKKTYLSKITGWNTIELTDKSTIKKSHIDTYIDFNSLAKGYAVDVLANYLSQKGSINYLVEIGGEIVAYGNSPKTGQPWSIAIDYPKQKNERRMIHRLFLNNEAIATSGNYRKFRVDVETGERYVHSINPLTGIPVKSNILSASVRAEDCMTADAYATALMILPLETGMELIKNLSDTEAYWITTSNDSIQEYFSDGWEK